jgi:hypothetical protein
LRPFADFDLAVAELTWRMHASGVRVLAVPGAVVVDPSPVASLRALRCAEVGTEAGRRELVDHHGPALLRGTSAARAAEPTRLAITVAAPSAKLAPRWGDWHLAHALARGVERLGHDVTVATLDRADTPQVRACDVHIVMRGLAPVRRTEGQRHVLWVISHPETITATECDAADLVLVASERFASELRRRTKTPVEVFLQATDHHRFRQIAPVAQHAHPVAVVAKTRDVMRPIVADALAAGIRPAIYGSGWERFVDKDLVVAQYVANDELPAVYSSVGVLLNDHWDTMREWGFVSNRLFDALACGTPVVSDHLDEIASLFAGAVPTYREANDLGDTVRALLADEAAARAAAAQGRQIVLDAHTFDHRARQLFNLFARCGVL